MFNGFDSPLSMHSSPIIDSNVYRTNDLKIDDDVMNDKLINDTDNSIMSFDFDFGKFNLYDDEISGFSKEIFPMDDTKDYENTSQQTPPPPEKIIQKPIKRKMKKGQKSHQSIVLRPFLSVWTVELCVNQLKQFNSENLVQ